VSDDEDFDEPEIPEYLIAEQRRGRQQAGGRGGQGGRGGPRGGRSAYTSAIERERYGRGGGGGINRYPDVSGRDRDRQPDRPQPSRSGGRPDAGFGRQERFDRPAPRSGDPWSEVPPELEEMLRAQLAQSPKGRRPVTEAVPTRVEAEAGPVADAAAPKRRAPSRRKAEPVEGGAPETPATESMPAGSGLGEPSPEDAAPKRRTTTRRKAEPAAAVASTPIDVPVPDTAPKPRATTRRKAASADSAPATYADEAATAPPKRRTATRKKAEPA
jgi:hypothetical protein